MTETNPAETTGALSAAVDALGAVIARMERQQRTLTALIETNESGGDIENAERLRVKREGLRIGLADARDEFDLAVANLRAAAARTTVAALLDGASVPLINYSVALDEIFVLRKALAHEALRQQVDLDFKTFPKSRRAIAEAAVERMQAAARGHAEHAYGDRSSHAMRHALREAGAPETLTRAAWEASRGLGARPVRDGQS